MRQLYAAQKIFKITDHYVVTDEGGYTVYQVDENYRVLGKNMNVTNVETGVQFTLERQLGLVPFSMLAFPLATSCICANGLNLLGST